MASQRRQASGDAVVSLRRNEAPPFPAKVGDRFEVVSPSVLIEWRGRSGVVFDVLERSSEVQLELDGDGARVWFKLVQLRRERVSPVQVAPGQGLTCSFCGKTHRDVTHLIAGPSMVLICNECVALSADIISGKATPVLDASPVPPKSDPNAGLDWNNDPSGIPAPRACGRSPAPYDRCAWRRPQECATHRDTPRPCADAWVWECDYCGQSDPSAAKPSEEFCCRPGDDHPRRHEWNRRPAKAALSSSPDRGSK